MTTNRRRWTPPQRRRSGNSRRSLKRNNQRHAAPVSLSTAQVTVLSKLSQTRSFPENYRSNSLLIVVWKIVEGILLRRLQRELDEGNVLRNEQLFLDVSMVFDKVWHHGFLYKMNILSALVQLVVSYLRERWFCIKQNGSRSSMTALTAVVSQSWGWKFTLWCPTLLCWLASRDCDSSWFIYRWQSKNSKNGFESGGSRPIPIRALRSIWSSYDDVTMFGRPISWGTQTKYLHLI